MAEQSLEVDNNALTSYEANSNHQLSIQSIDDIRRVSLIFVKSGMFKGDDKMTEEQKLYQAGVKIIAGIEFGIQPFAAMRGINIIKGNAEMSANLMAAKVKKHPKYDYTVEKWDREGCILIFHEIPRPGAPRSEWFELGLSSFDVEDAKIAGLAGGDNWRKFFRNMAFARAMSNGVRTYCPDVFYGAPVYVEGETTAVTVQSVDDEPAAPEPPQADPEPVEGDVVEPDADEAEAESAPDEEQEAKEPFIDTTEYMTKIQRERVKAVFDSRGLDSKDDRLELASVIIERDIKSLNELTKAEAAKLIEQVPKEEL